MKILHETKTSEYSIINKVNKEFDSIQNYKPFLNELNLERNNGTITSTLITKKSLNFIYNLDKVTNSKDNSNNIKITYKDNLYEYLKTLTPYLPNLRQRGISVKYQQNNSYFFTNNKINNNILNNPINIATIKNTNKLLLSFFKSLYCIISKPVFLITPDKVIIKLFYYLNIPKYKVYKWFSMFYINRIKKYSIYKKYLLSSATNLSIKNRFLNKKLKKAIFSLKSKYYKSLYAPVHKKLNNGKLLIFNLFKNNLNKVYQNKFKIICDILSRKFNRPVEIQLTRLHHPYQDSNILVNLLAMNLKNKRKNSRILIKKIYNRKPVKNLNSELNLSIISGSNGNIINNLIPNAFISGLNIKIAGRLMREPIIPRLTTKTFEKGARATGKVNFLDTSSITHKNRKGAFTIKIVSGQNFYT